MNVDLSGIARDIDDLAARLRRLEVQEKPGNFTAGSVLFGGSDGRITQDNANLFWDDTNNQLGIGTTAPTAQFHAKRTDSYYQYKSESASRVYGWGTSGTSFFLDDVTGGARRLTIDSSGNHTFGGNLIATGTGTNILLGDLRLQNSGGTARYLRLYNAGGTNETLIRDGGGSGVASLQLRPADTLNITVEASKLGFMGTAAISKPSVTGSRGGNAALASLLTALANYGLITDSSS